MIVKIVNLTTLLTLYEIFANFDSVPPIVSANNLSKEPAIMKVIVYLLGFSHIALCTYLILYTRESIDIVKGLFNTYRLKYLSAIPAAYAFLFLISATAISHPWVFIIIGLLAAVEAVVAFTNPKKIYSEMLEWYFNKVPEQTNRLFGIIGVVFGTVILTWIK